MLSLGDVLRGADDIALAYQVSSELGFTGVTQDSRLVQEGNLFVALRAERDGHDFIPDAFRRGASGVLAERVIPLDWIGERDRNSFAYLVAKDSLKALQHIARRRLKEMKVPVIAVTGSVGKTTTKEVIAAVLQQRYRVLKSEKNLNNEIGLPLTLLRLGREQERAVLEMGMYARGEIAGLCRIAPPRIGVVTNVGPSHLARLGTIERIAEAKAELVAALPAEGYAVLNGDDPRVTAMAERTKAQVRLYGFGSACDLRATDLVTHGLAGISLTINNGDAAISISSRLAGGHYAYACLAAAAVARIEGLTWPEIQRGLAQDIPKARIHTVQGRNGTTIIDDTYNASPASVKAALDLLSTLPGRRIAILADMVELGREEEEGHRGVGRHAAGKVDKLIVVGERGRLIGEQARLDGLREVVFAQRKEDVELCLEPGDHVLVKGSRSMAMEDLVARLREPEGVLD